MPGQVNLKEKKSWSDIIFNADIKSGRDIAAGSYDSDFDFISKAANDLYGELRRVKDLFISPFSLDKEFSKIPYEEVSFWCDLVGWLPTKLASINVLIRPFRDFCRTCIITDREIDRLAAFDHDRYCRNMIARGWKYGKKLDLQQKTDPLLGSARYLPEKRKRFYLELNYAIPLLLKKNGFEIFRTEENTGIDDRIIRKLARAIHSRYLHQMRKEGGDERGKAGPPAIYKKAISADRDLPDFEDLPADVKYSNIDNAYHIPTKLLATGFRIRPVRSGYKTLTLHLSDDEVETMAMLEHMRWCWDKRLNGWIYGSVKSTKAKKHPDLIPYENLSESAKEKDRNLVRLIPALLQDIDYEAFPVNPGTIRRLSYAIKPQGIIQKILDESRQLNEQIRGMVTLTPEVEKMVTIRNKKIEEAITEVEGSYNYARHIQETFLPDDLYIRECFPDSFILYKPKDIVSGDFYFFSRQKHQIVFAAADCTGHGIPGALLSTIGYGILDQAVNELMMADPPDVLNHLYSRLHRFLRRDDDGFNLSDDMDIVLCTFDLRTNLLLFSGVTNPLYRVSGGEVIEYRAGNVIEEINETGDFSFTSEIIMLNPGDSIYLCSDGYIDQFGGKRHKKYLKSRFRALLSELQQYSMPEQSDKLYEEIECWREGNNEDQTDDILVIGIRM